MWLAAAILLPRLAAEPPPDAIKLLQPGVEYRINIASASSRPWVNANGWRLERGGGKPFLYDVTGETAALAAAEAFAYQREAAIHTDEAGSRSFSRMLAFLQALPEGPANVMADVGVVDDGSAQTGEVLNLLARHNLLFQVEKAPNPNLPVNVELGSKEYPKFSAANPNEFAQRVRQQITDEKRILRIYGSDVVLARMTGDGKRVRLHLVNYGGRPIHGLHVRVLGRYRRARIAAFDVPDAELRDFDAQRHGTEFTLPLMRTYAVVDLFSR